MKSYQKYLESSRPEGENVSSARKPVFRSSAIFPVKHNEVFTSRISFMGYWLLKRDIREITVLATLRSRKGVILRRQSLLVDSPKAFVFELSGLVSGLEDEKDFTGSLELEVFSTRNLFFPYPAFVLCYYNEHFSTAVHTTGRAYNDLEDMKENEETPAPEAGFDIYPDKALKSFFAFTNGPLVSASPRIEYTVVNHAGKEFHGLMEFPDVGAYETLFVYLDERMDLAGMLEEKPGTIKLTHPFKGFYPRFTSGNFDKSSGVVSITHSYYDCSQLSSDSDYWVKKDDSLYHAAILLPLFMEKDFFTDLVFYPIYSPSRLSVSLYFYDENGVLTAKLPDFKKLDTRGGTFERIEFNRTLQELKSDLRKIKGADIVCQALDGSPFPTRLKMGLNVGRRGAQSRLPTNICFAPKIGNPDRGKARSFHWAPLLNVGESVLVMTNSSAQKNYAQEARVRLRFFNQNDGQTLERQLIVPAHGQRRVSVAEDKELKGFFGAAGGWAVFESDNPYVYGWYFDFHSSGASAGDHCF